MKIAICGKGGVGKTTLASLLIRYLWQEGFSVLGVDADPALNLALALGFPKEVKITPIAQMQDLINERMDIQNKGQALFKLNPTVEDIPDKYVYRHQGISLIVMGSIERGGSGCACPASTFLKALLSHILLNKEEVAIIDMEAGLEHLGRATSSSVNCLVIVIEPNQSSIEVAKKIYKLAQDIKIKNIVAVANKIKDKDDLEFINNNFKQTKLIGRMNYSEDILLFGQGKEKDLLKNKEIYESVKEIKEKLYNAAKN